MQPLSQQYRPKQWDEVAGQDAALKRLRAVARRGFGGRAFWLSGPSGCGKTTLAGLIAREIADEFGILDLDATDITGAQVRDIERSNATRSIGAKSGRAVIVNEAQGLRRDAVKQLLTTLERIPDHVAWIFTTIDTGDGLFGADLKGHPLLSRCHDVRLAGGNAVELAFAIRAREIAQIEGLDGKPLEDYVALVRRHKSNLRAVLAEIEEGGLL